LQGFASDGDLVIVDRVGDDVDQVADIVEQCEASGLLDKVGCDPAGIGAILDALEEAGVPHEKIVSVGQGWRLNASIKTLERKLAGGELVHAGQPLMAWSVGNARQEPRGNAVIITKQASGKAKIDPVMAALNAVHLMSLNPASQGKSFWDRE
jgi:phage terminase large subunit-like protein